MIYDSIKYMKYLGVSLTKIWKTYKVKAKKTFLSDMLYS